MTKKRFPVVLVISTICFILYPASFVAGFVLFTTLTVDDAPRSKETAFTIFFDLGFWEGFSISLFSSFIGAFFALAAMVTAWISLYKTTKPLLPALILAFSVPGSLWGIVFLIGYIFSLL